MQGYRHGNSSSCANTELREIVSDLSLNISEEELVNTNWSESHDSHG